MAWTPRLGMPVTQSLEPAPASNVNITAIGFDLTRNVFQVREAICIRSASIRFAKEHYELVAYRRTRAE